MSDKNYCKQCIYRNSSNHSSALLELSRTVDSSGDVAYRIAFDQQLKLARRFATQPSATRVYWKPKNASQLHETMGSWVGADNIWGRKENEIYEF